MKYLLALLLPLAVLAADPAPTQAPTPIPAPPWQPTASEVQQGYQAAAYAEAQQATDALASVAILKARITELEQQLAAAKAPPPPAKPAAPAKKTP